MSRVVTVSVLLTCGVVSIYAGLEIRNRLSAPAVASPRAVSSAIERIRRGELTIPIEPTLAFGAVAAPVVIIELADYDCRYCGAHSRETLPAIKRMFIDTGMVRYVFRGLATRGKLSMRAAALAHCAGQLGRFEQAHNGLFGSLTGLKGVDWEALEASLDLSRDEAATFGGCLRTTGPAAVEKQTQQARALATSGTPTFLVGKATKDDMLEVWYRLNGAVPLAAFEQVVNEVNSK